MHELFTGTFGLANPLRSRAPETAKAIDREVDLDFEASGGRAKIEQLARDLGQRKVQVIVPVDTSRPYDLRALIDCLRNSRHIVNIHVDVDEACGRSKKINRTVAERSILASDMDWFLVIDDDVAVEPGFLDRFLAASEAAMLVLAQPAHRMHSHASYEVTQRNARSLVRRTRFVEVGPVVAVHRSVFHQVLPLPETRWGWGPDFLWADTARRLDWRIGIVDGTAIEHLRPVNFANAKEAMREASEMLDLHDVRTIGRVEMLSRGTVALSW